MHRRSFIAALFGGTAALAGGAAFARSTPAGDAVAAGPVNAPAEALDQTEAEFTHMPPGPRWRAHRAWHRRNRRTRRRWRRRVWRGGRWRYYW